jgi:hypothetical protein
LVKQLGYHDASGTTVRQYPPITNLSKEREGFMDRSHGRATFVVQNNPTSEIMSTSTVTRTTAEVANRLIALCREGKFVDAINELYAPHVVSIEPEGGPGAARIEGFEAVVNKSIQFGKSMEAVHSMTVSDPLIAENFFCLRMHIDLTMTGAGRVQMDELCVYEVKDGKVVRDQFFYTPMPMPSHN